MAQGTLVDSQIESGRELIQALADDGFGVAVAFWAQESEDGLWFLYIASPVVDARGLFEAYGVVQTQIGGMPGLAFDSFDVKLIGESNPIAGDARWLRDESIPTWFGGGLFAGVGIDRGYLYPPVAADATY